MTTWAQLIMLGTLFGLIVLIFGLVLHFDPEARRAPGRGARPVSDQMTPVLTAASDFALVGGIAFTAIGIYLSVRRRRLHPLLLLCISAISFSWIEAPYDWAMYAQFPPALPRMPSWWPLNMTWGGLPLSVPIGYISYFVLPAVIGAALGRWLSARFDWRRPITLLIVGLVVGFCWALFFNAVLGARLGVFYYGYVIPGLAIVRGHQAPVPALRLPRDGHPDDGLHLPARPHRCRRTQRHRDVGRQAVEDAGCSRRCCPSSPSSSSDTCSTARFSRRISSRSWGVR